MKVAFTVEQAWHRVPGGTAVAAIEAARALLRRDDVDLVGLSARHGGAPNMALPGDLELRQMPLPRVALYESWQRLRRPKVDIAVTAPDVIHATAFPVPPRSSALVLTVHDLAFVHEPAHFTPHGNRFFRRGLELALEDADIVVCPSEATLADCVAQGFKRDRLRVVPLGVDLRRASEEEVIRVKAKHGLGKPYVLWVGTIEPRKNLPALARAFATLDRSDVELVIVGPSGWNEDVDGAMAPIAEKVRVLGSVDRKELSALYAGATVFCFPSLLEGFGFPVLEAMAQGTAVVTSRGTSTEEISGDAALLIDPRDPGTIAEALARLLDDDGARLGLESAGLARAEGYTWERTAQGLADIYREAAA